MILLNLAYEIGLEPKWVASTHGGEYHSPCPSCGGEDRFYIQPNRAMKNCVGYYCCRQCNISGDAIQFCRDFLGYTFQEAVACLDAVILEPRRYSSFIKPIPKKLKPVKLIPPSDLWMKKAKQLITESHEQIFNQKKLINYLHKRGLPIEAVSLFKFGYLSNEIFDDPKAWEIEQREKAIWIPKGIIIPSIKPDGEIIRLKIRRSDWNKDDEYQKYIAIPGSMNGLNIVGNTSREILIIVESELDAYAINFAADDFVCAIAVGSCMKNPDNVVDCLAKQKKYLLICHDNDAPGKNMLKKWTTIYPHAKACPSPYGKDIGEAISMGLYLREWILSILPARFKKVYSKSATEIQSQPNKTHHIHLPTVIEQPMSQAEKPIKSLPIEDWIKSEHTKKIMSQEAYDHFQSLTPDRQKAVRCLMDTFGAVELTIEPIEEKSCKQEKTWSDQDKQLIDKFYELERQEKLPKPPFKLNPWTEITGPKFYESLKMQIKLGPDYVRARSGVLQEDLAMLLRFIDQQSL